MATVTTSYQALIPYLNRGEIVVMPTDTIYGVVTRADNPEAVGALYELKQRDLTKPFIVLVASFEQLQELADELTPEMMQLLDWVWPGPSSVVLPSPEKQYLHRGTGGIAYRIPANAELRGLLEVTGPLVAPSANPESHPPAKTAEEAQAYFGERVAAYYEAGTVDGAPSTLIALQPDGSYEVLRGRFPEPKLA